MVDGTIAEFRTGRGVPVIVLSQLGQRECIVLLITVLGLPSLLSQRIVPALRVVAQIALGSVDFLHFTTIEQLQEQWIQRRSDHVILHTDNPDVRIANLLTINAKQIILVSEDPTSVALHFRYSRSMELEFAIRSASSIFASLHDIILGCQNLLMLSPDNCATPKSFIELVLQFLDLKLSNEQADEILRSIAEADGKHWLSGKALDGDAHHRLDGDEQALIHSLNPYGAIFRMRPAEGFNWPRGLFFGTDRMGQPLDAPFAETIELVGPARILCYGPYFHLPPGEWTLRASLEVNDNYSGNELLIEIMIGLEVQVHRPALLPVKGHYGFEVPFTVVEPRNAVQLRLWTRQGAIEGTLALGMIEVRKTHRDRA
ncbi:hypothetical protein [Labrys sp. 22185]|uniref:hypothetical protein n=1 Tax=Labrys sp. 22185 TaxID=3453888 RepID=UPI003F865D59